MRLRAIELEDASADGSFTGMLATSGEASDGHRLNMNGGNLEAGLPLLVNHREPLIGQWTGFERVKLDDGVGIRGTARINMDGEGSPAELRRDLALLVSSGDIRGLSLRWDVDSDADVQRRIDLPKAHPAHVGQDEPHRLRRFGLFFAAWRGVEGSIGFVPKDRETLIGRSERSEDVFVRDFYRTSAESLAVPLDLSEDPHVEALARGVADLGLDFAGLRATVEGIAARLAQPEAAPTATQLAQPEPQLRAHVAPGDLVESFRAELRAIEERQDRRALDVIRETLGR